MSYKIEEIEGIRPAYTEKLVEGWVEQAKILDPLITH
jgi:hypothetical protein